MKKTLCISFILICIFIMGCSSSSRIYKEMSADDRKNISVIGLKNFHYKVEEAFIYWKTATSLNGTTKIPLGYSGEYSYSTYKNVLSETMRKVKVQLELDFPDDSFSVKTYKYLANQTNNISIIPIASKNSSPSIESIKISNKEFFTKYKKSVILSILIYHDVNAENYYKPEISIYISALIEDSLGNTLYHRNNRSESWIVTDKFLKDEYKSLVEKEIKSAAQIFWKDITGDSTLQENNI